jgi:H+/Cl- antiporter ClcA
MDIKATPTTNAASNIKVAATTVRKRRVWPWMLLLLIVVGVVGYTYASLNWAYSDGERVGVLQKLSRKGWVCKTWEGELALYVVSGVAPQIWPFTVRDDQVAKTLNVSLGKRVRLHYDEHRGIPSNCFGDTQYFVDRGAEALP